MVKFHPFPEREGPGEPISRGFPELGESRSDREGLVELDETIEELLGD